MATVQQCTPELASQDRGPELVGSVFGLLGLACIFVGLRFLSRYLSNTKLWWDDWLIVVALIMCFACDFTTIPLYVHGFGKHEACADPDVDRLWHKILLFWEYMYSTVLVIVKYSILLFLRRIFNVGNFKYYFWAIWIVLTLWEIGVTVAVSLSCVPLHAFWGDGKGSCIDMQALYVGNEVPNIVTDLALLALPVPYLMRLQMPRLLRFSLIAVFGCGFLVVAISCYRLYILLNTSYGPDISYNDVPEGMWTLIEHNVAIISACLPSLSPLCRMLLKTFGIDISSTGTAAGKKVGEETTSNRRRWFRRFRKEGDELESNDQYQGHSVSQIPTSEMTHPPTYRVETI